MASVLVKATYRALAAAFVALPILVGAQAGVAVPTRALGAHDAEYSVPFTTVTSVRELSDGRVVVGDPSDRTVQLIDFRSRVATKVGREGSGPGEFRVVGRLIAGRADSTFLVDRTNRRLLTILPNGVMGEPVPYSMPAPAPNVAPSTGDTLRRLYGEVVSIPTAVAGVVQFPESTAVVRMDLVAGRRDTVAWLREAKATVTVSSAPGSSQGQMRIRGASPFSGRDGWAVGSDGSVAVVRMDPYRVDWTSPTGARTSGVLPSRRLPVTAADKERVIEASRPNMNAMSGALPAGLDIRGLIDNMDWPEFKPPFMGAVHVSPDGRAWIPATPPLYGDPITYDVVDARGRLVERVAFPPRVRLVGFSGRSMYTVRIDDDDLQYLQRRKP
jgi:hypothetical protein